MKKDTCRETKYVGIKELPDGSGYVAVLDYGRQPRLDKKTGKYVVKQARTQRKSRTLREARQAVAEAGTARRVGTNTSGIKSTKFSDMTGDFKKSARYNDLEDNYRRHYDNYISHLNDFFGETDVREISVAGMENYYRYQPGRGNLSTAKRNADGTVNKKEGITINTVQKHKTAPGRSGSS